MPSGVMISGTSKVTVLPSIMASQAGEKPLALNLVTTVSVVAFAAAGAAATAVGAGAGAAAGAVVAGAADADAGAFSAGFEQAAKLIHNRPAAAVMNKGCFISNFSLRLDRRHQPDGGRITGKTIHAAKWMTQISA